MGKHPFHKNDEKLSILSDCWIDMLECHEIIMICVTVIPQLKEILAGSYIHGETHLPLIRLQQVKDWLIHMLKELEEKLHPLTSLDFLCITGQRKTYHHLATFTSDKK